MLFFIIELDEDRIKKDGIVNLDAAYECIDDTFAQKEVILYCKNGTKRYYTRNIDDKTQKVYTNEDVLKQWVVRPEKP